MESTEQFQPKQPPIIVMTMDYDQFKVLKYNRDINHMSKVSNGISRSNKLYLHPIIVNPNMEIIDGQHRWSYAKHTQQPIYYIVDENFEPSDLIAHNMTSTNWASKDYCYFYSTCNCSSISIEQRRDYTLCLEVCKEFNLSFETFLRLFHSRKGKMSGGIEFKKGRLKLNSSKKEIFDSMISIDEILKFTLKLKLIKRINSEIYVALYSLINLNGYNKERMFMKLRENLDLVLTIFKFKSYIEIFSRLLDLYNKNAKQRLEITKNCLDSL